MVHCHVFMAVDRTFRDICGNEHQPFGEKLFVFVSDIRQVLPVVTKGGRADSCSINF